MKSYKIALVLGPANNYSEVRLRNIKADADRPVIVVLDFHAPNMPSFDAEVLSQFVRSAVVRSHAYKVVDKKNMDKVLAEQAFQQTGFLSPEYAVKVGKILNAHFILLGAYSRFEGSRLLSAQIVGVETSHIIASDSERILERGNTQASAENLVARLLRTVKDGNLHEGIDENQAEIKLDIHESEFPNLLDSLPRQKSSKRWLTFGGIVTAIFVAVVAL